MVICGEIIDKFEELVGLDFGNSYEEESCEKVIENARSVMFL